MLRLCLKNKASLGNLALFKKPKNNQAKIMPKYFVSWTNYFRGVVEAKDKEEAYKKYLQGEIEEVEEISQDIPEPKIEECKDD